MTAAYGPSRFERRADRCPLCGTPVGDPHESADCPSGDYDGDAHLDGAGPYSPFSVAVGDGNGAFLPSSPAATGTGAIAAATLKRGGGDDGLLLITGDQFSLARTLELLGGRDVSMDHPRCRARGSEEQVCEFRLRWRLKKDAPSDERIEAEGLAGEARTPGLRSGGFQKIDRKW